MSSASDERKLAFIFLANDVVQTSRKRGPEFVEAFASALPGALRHVAKHGAAADAAQLRRLVAVWEERRVFGAGRTLSALKAAVGVTEEAAAPSCAEADESLAAAQAALRNGAAGARGAVIAALRVSLTAHEAAAKHEADAAAAAPAEHAAPAVPVAQPAAPAAADEGYDPGGYEYDPADALLAFPEGASSGPAAVAVAGAAAQQTPMAAVMGALAGLPAGQREALGAALAAAAVAAAAAEAPSTATEALQGAPPADAATTEGEPASKRAKTDE